MSYYEQLLQKPNEIFKRRSGINKKSFEIIFEQLKREIKEEKEKQPKSKRVKKGALSIADQLLLCLVYLRSYKTFLELGAEFGISEGYANKVFHKISKRLIKILKLPSKTDLAKEGLKAVVIDASEQPIERPMKNQKDYYSGKKTTYNKGTASNLPFDRLDNKD